MGNPDTSSPDSKHILTVFVFSRIYLNTFYFSSHLCERRPLSRSIWLANLDLVTYSLSLFFDAVYLRNVIVHFSFLNSPFLEWGNQKMLPWTRCVISGPRTGPKQGVHGPRVHVLSSPWNCPLLTSFQPPKNCLCLFRQILSFFTPYVYSRRFNLPEFYCF